MVGCPWPTKVLVISPNIVCHQRTPQCGPFNLQRMQIELLGDPIPRHARPAARRKKRHTPISRKPRVVS